MLHEEFFEDEEIPLYQRQSFLDSDFDFITLDESIWDLMVHVNRNSVHNDLRESHIWNTLSFALDNDVDVMIPMGAMGFTYDREFLIEHGFIIPQENHDVTDDNIVGSTLVDCLMKMYRLCVLYHENERAEIISEFINQMMICVRNNLPLDSAC